jgi:hypothetical protein
MGFNSGLQVRPDSFRKQANLGPISTAAPFAEVYLADSAKKAPGETTVKKYYD